MVTFFRWLWRALLAVLVLLMLAGVWVCWEFEEWKKQAVAALESGSKIAQTAVGPIEYTESGSGPAVLICHGAPGGYDQAALLGRDLAQDGFRIIAPSRPGFLRTPLASGLTFEDQAAAFAALLDTLGVKKVSLLGFSTGAQVAERFALRYPERTTALVLLSPATSPYRPLENEDRHLLPETALYGTTGDMGSWLFVEQSKRDPRWMLDAVFSADTSLDAKARGTLVDFVRNDPRQLAFFQNLLRTQAPLSPRESGTRNDLVLLRALEPIDFAKIQAPVLVVNGSADMAKPWNDPRPILVQQPAAHLVTVENAGQLVWFGPQANRANQAVREFLKNPPLRSAPAAQEAPPPADQ